jgi:hypothetical protein
MAVINAVNAALCMREMSQGVQDCTAVMVSETAILRFASYCIKTVPWSPLPSYECKRVLHAETGKLKTWADIVARKVAGVLVSSAICV